MSILISNIFILSTSQAALAKEQAERNSKANLEKIEENEKRMEVAQGNMKKMLEKDYIDDADVEEDTSVYFREEMFDSEDDEAVASALRPTYSRADSGLEASTKLDDSEDGWSSGDEFIVSDDDLDDEWYN